MSFQEGTSLIGKFLNASVGLNILHYQGSIR